MRDLFQDNNRVISMWACDIHFMYTINRNESLQDLEEHDINYHLRYWKYMFVSIFIFIFCNFFHLKRLFPIKQNLTLHAKGHKTIFLIYNGLWQGVFYKSLKVAKKRLNTKQQHTKQEVNSFPRIWNIHNWILFGKSVWRKNGNGNYAR